MSKKLITTGKVMEMLNISKGQVYKLLASGVIGAIDVSKPESKRPRYRFDEDEIKKFIDKRIVFERKQVRVEGNYSTK